MSALDLDGLERMARSLPELQHSADVLALVAVARAAVALAKTRDKAAAEWERTKTQCDSTAAWAVAYDAIPIAEADLFTTLRAAGLT